MWLFQVISGSFEHVYGLYGPDCNVAYSQIQVPISIQIEVPIVAKQHSITLPTESF